MKFNPKILVTGANGYLGSHLSSRLIELGYDVVLSDIGDESILDYHKYVKHDFSKPEKTEDLIIDIDIIFFFTGKTGPAQEGFNKPKEFIVGNEVTLSNLLCAVKNLSEKPKIVFPSTRLLYKGVENLALSEESEIEAKTVYALNKIACENLLDLYQRCFDINYVVFRISLPYGSFIPQKKVSYGIMSYLLNKAKNNQNLQIYGTGNQVGTFLHVYDLVEMLIAGGISDKMINDVFNIGGHDNLKMKDVIEAIAKKFDISVEYVNWPNISKFAEHGDLIINSNKFSSLLQVNPKYNFNKWIKEVEI